MIIAESVAIPINDAAPVSGLWLAPPAARMALVLAHGAGAGMTHRGMAAIADGLATRGVASLRYQFPYMDKGSKRPDPPAIAHGAVRAAVDEARRLAPGVTLFAGGRSFGARMTSQAQAASALPDVRGLVFFAFPLHPAGKPGDSRADHLNGVSIPMLFLQGDRDALAEPSLLSPVIARLASRATLHAIPQADHSFHVPAKSGRKDADVMAECLDITVAWMTAIAAQPKVLA